MGLRGSIAGVRALWSAWLLAGIVTAAIAQPDAVRPPAAALQTERVWVLRAPDLQNVTFRGRASFDKAGLATSPMMYGPGPIGFVAGLVTHGVLLSALQKEQKNRIQTQADRVLLPYEEVLSQFTNSQLMQSGLARMPHHERMRLATPTDQTGDVWMLDSAPVFWMSADERALVLEHVVRAFAPGQSAPLFEHSVRVVSAPLPVPSANAAAVAIAVAVAEVPIGAASVPDDGARVEAASVASRPSTVWLAEGGRRLKETSAAMYAESLDVVLTESAAQRGDRTPPQQQTFRYIEGGSERMERAEFVADRCGRTLIRTLRGSLMSVPSSVSSLPCSPRVVIE